MLYSIEQVHEELRAAAKRSLEKIDQMKCARLTEPITATLRVIPPADLPILARQCPTAEAIVAYKIAYGRHYSTP